MKLDDVLTLAKAGFTAEQIAAMIKDQPAAAPAVPAQAAPAPAAPEPAPAPAAPAPAPARPADVNEGYKEMMAAISDLSNTIKASNILGSSQPEAPTVDDILAEIINPRGSH